MLLNAFRRIFRKAQNRKARRSYTCPQLLQLESRIVPANFQVTSLGDTATGGTLREAIDLANTTAGNDTIGFAPSLFSTGEGTIFFTFHARRMPRIFKTIQPIALNPVQIRIFFFISPYLIANIIHSMRLALILPI